MQRNAWRNALISTDLRSPRIQGTFVPLVTPLSKAREVDEGGVKRLISSLKPPADGFIPCLSTGEGRYLDDRTWCRMLESTSSEAGDKRIVAGIEASTTADVVRRTREARALGLNIIITLPPFGDDVPQDEIFEHFAQIADVGLELIVYNKQMMCGTPIHIDTLIRICREIPGVVGVKEGSMDPVFTQRLLAAVPEVAVFHAWEHLFTKTPTHGSIAALSNLEPGLCCKAIENPGDEIQGRVDEAVVRYNIGPENMSWFRDIKSEPVRRGIIETDLCLPDLL